MLASLLVVMMLFQVDVASFDWDTPVHLRFLTRMSSTESHAGDSVEMVVLNDVSVHGRVVLPAGTKFAGEVIYAVRGERESRNRPEVLFGIDRVILPDGDTYDTTGPRPIAHMSCEPGWSENRIQGGILTSHLGGYYNVVLKVGYTAWCHVSYWSERASESK